MFCLVFKTQEDRSLCFVAQNKTQKKRCLSQVNKRLLVCVGTTQMHDTTETRRTTDKSCDIYNYRTKFTTQPMPKLDSFETKSHIVDRPTDRSIHQNSIVRLKPKPHHNHTTHTETFVRTYTID